MRPGDSLVYVFPVLELQVRATMPGGFVMDAGNHTQVLLLAEQSLLTELFPQVDLLDRKVMSEKGKGAGGGRAHSGMLDKG